MEEEWNNLIAASKNGTFLLDRQFMDYHNDRFCDCSVLIRQKGKAIAAFPANFCQTDGTVWSHQGLTYGGLILSPQCCIADAMKCFDLIMDYYRNEFGAKKIVFKLIPFIYNVYPSDEALYLLFRHNARLRSRGLSTCISLQNKLKMSELRRRGIKKATLMGITVRETDDIEGYWNILDDVLTSCHNLHPVHTPQEMKLLQNRFPDRIHTYASYSDKGEMLAGTWVFDTGNVIHTQYLASSAKGKNCGALDLLISFLISDVYKDRQYMDFGISTERNGTVLNEGLVHQKEGFGGRAICYDTYEIDL